ncbi:hypothetical protein J8657_15000 [Dickeya oryzae]|uniref:Uncharacterized protein n=2 Tax=Dickeya oryzae TaxID=1240404 RepID=A0ABS5BEL4_9GAMM|nr:hypothetical protein [Dickeya oryzae]
MGVCMKTVKVKWFSANEGGRKNPPPVGRYFSVARFPDDKVWQNNAWSVVLDLSPPENIGGDKISSGFLDFMMDNAPKEKLEENDTFEIYEGPHKVGVVSILEK